jgi:hypothetical protein
MSKFIIICALLFTSLQAYEESFPFLGVSISTQTVDLKPTSASSQRETTLNVRYGQQTLDWRTTFAIGGNGSFQTFSLEIDKILLDNMFGMPELRPYLGATVGYINYKDNAILNDNGLYYGGNFGFIVYVTDSIDADVSYHYYGFDNLAPLDIMQGGTIGFNFFY